MGPFKFIKNVDVAPMLYELGINSMCWLTESQERSKIPEQRDTKCLILRDADKRNTSLHARDIQPCIDTHLAPLFSRTLQFLHDFASEEGADLYRVMIVALNPGGEVKAHYDAGEYYLDKDRYHLVVQSEGSYMLCGDESSTWKTGELWWFDNKRIHLAKNEGDSERIHIIFDLKPNTRPAIRTNKTELDEYKFERNLIFEKQLISKETCQKIIQSINENFKPVAASIGEGNTARKDTSIRDVGIVRSNQPRLIRETFEKIIHEYVEPHFGITIAAYSFPQFLKYEESGKYEPHTDAVLSTSNGKNLKLHDRDITLLIYLNDDFTGGYLGFPNHARTIHPKTGTVVSFPSGEHFLHAAFPVMSGTRYALVSWMTCLGSTREHSISYDAIRLIEDEFLV